MAVFLSPVGGVAAQFFDNNGVILTGGKIYTYTAGTTTPQTTYTSNTGATAHSNPIILDASGRVPGGEIWLTDGLSYKFVIKDANEVLIGTYDNVVGINSNFINYTGEQEIQTATASQTVFTLTTMQYQPGTNSLSVFVDGVNQYGPGAQYAYVETSSTVITFVTGLHVGASVKFTTATINSASATSADQVSYTPAGTGAVVTNVQAKLRQYVSVKDFGAVGDGVADDSAAIQAAITASPYVFIPAGTYKTSVAITASATTAILGSGMGVSILSCTNGDVSQIILNGNESTIQNLSVHVTTVGTTSQIGGVIVNANYCQIQNVEVSGVSWAGVFLYGGASYNIVENCYFHNFQGSIQDSSDICVSYDNGAASYNTITKNRCYGGNETGVLILGGTSTFPAYNLISENKIGQHTTYGIATYRTTNANAFDQIMSNFVEDIQGTTLSGNSGAGIYVVAAGGVLIEGNTIRNCCVQTTGSTLAPAGIGINGISSGIAPVNIVGNVIEQMTKWEGILIVSSSSGANVVGNRIRMPINTTGSGGIYVNASSNVVVSSNYITITPTTGATVNGIFVNASSSLSNIIVNNNTIFGGNAASIRFFSSSNNISGATITGNSVNGGGVSAVGLQLSKIAGGVVTGNFCGVTSTNAINVSACTAVRYANNSFTTTGSIAVSTAGTCTNSYFDKTNYWNGTMDNSAIGLIVEWLNNASPSSGNWSLGDRVEQSVPVVGQPKGWRCTVAGTSGTWVSEGNL